MRAPGLGFVGIEQLEQHRHVGVLEVVGRPLDLAGVMHVAVADIVLPFDVVDRVDAL